MAVSNLLESPRFVRRATWVAAAILVAGIVAFSIAFFRNTAEPVASAPSAGAPAAETTEVAQPTVPVPPEARKVAGEFILTAVAREDLATSWDLVAPELKEGYTKEEWASGNIPIQYYPADSIETASFAVEESTDDNVVLQVALLPKDGADVEGQIFFIGLQKDGASWLVDYWAPRTIIAVPATGEN